MSKKLTKLFLLFLIVAVACIFVPPSVRASEKVFRNSLGMEFVLIAAGTFIMGSPPDEPYRSKSEVQHSVTVSRPFYMQTTEVTLKQWWAVMGKRFFGRRKGTADMPVARVSWYDCMRFIKKLNARNEGVYRLPTEAEWEYASRAGSTTAHNWGEAIDCSKAMFGNNSKKSNECLDYVRSRGLAVDRPAPVKSYPPNAWRLYDMHGNVWEWCHDWHGGYAKGSVVDPRGPDSGTKKIRRGGSWFGDGYLCRAANRNYSHPASRYRTTGFRLVWSKTGDWISREGERELMLMEEAREDGP
jgi:sulfatase modifying factor 1